MIKLINLLELEINKPTITAEEVRDYIYNNKLKDYFNSFKDYQSLIDKYEELYNPNHRGNDMYLIGTFSKPILYKFYQELKQLVNK